MIAIPDNYYSNLSCYEDFVIRTNLLGYDVSDAADFLKKFFYVTGDATDNIMYFAVGDDSDHHLCIIDNKGNKIENAVINGNFCCSWMGLTSLKGGPIVVKGSFSCIRNALTSLDGAPYKVGGYFSCSRCESLISLHGAPREVGGTFDCSFCDSLTSLEGAPTEVGGDFMCSECYSLTSLEGAPEKVGGYFKCIDCRSLTSLVGASRKIGGGFECDRCFSLSSLDGAPYLKSGCFYGFPTCNLSNKQVHEYFKWLTDYPPNHIGFETYHDKYAA